MYTTSDVERPRRIAPYVPLLPPSPWQRTDSVMAVAIFLGSLALYTSDLARTLTSTSFDSPELITKSAQLRLAHIPGSPVYVWLGHLFSWLPFGEVAARVSWMSAVMGSLAVTCLFAVIRRHVTRERLTAVGGALFFGLSITFWSQAVIAELYAPSIAFLALVLLALLEWGSASGGASTRGRWWLAAAAGAFGLSLGIHLSNTLYLPAFGLFALLGWPARGTGARVPLLRRFDLVGGLLCVLVGSAAAVVPYVWVYYQLPLVPPGDSFPQAAPGWPLFYETTFNAFHSFRFGYTLQEVPDRVVLFLHLLSRNLGPAGVALMLVGLWRLLFTRLRTFFLLVAMAVANLVFYVNYKVPDNDVYYIPSYLIAACCVGAGLDVVAAAVGATLKSAQPSGQPAGQVPSVGRSAGGSIGLLAWVPHFGPAAVWLPTL
ncbi:MAG TPA: DUF2723 domain-containing protein, partial [Chloroflexia bacterium]|nr:DUF2723 domain-containing protein [Chloroflexia bacterium]